MKNLYLVPIKAYQYISKMFPASCRYYPSCSEYAKWQFAFNHPSHAFVATSLRILRCNQFFKGGIDYPIIRMNPSSPLHSLKPNSYYSNIKVEYWLVPKSMDAHNNEYYLLKDFDAINAQRST